ncbi:MAG TPA: serine hydrolase domain-containing protein, partial [Longimicrobiales bacterium]
MRRLFVRAVVLSGAFLAPIALRAQEAISPPEKYAAAVRALESFIEHERGQKAIPAISVALVEGGHVVYARGFGWADSAAGRRATAATVYRVGSVSKLFTDIGIMRLVEQGKLDLDRPVQAWLPDFHPKNPFGGEITIRELTSHRAGLTREPPVGNYFDDTNPSLAATIASLNDTELVYKPGTHTKYSNAGIAVLGYLLQKTQGESFYPYLKRAVLEPMGLEHSAFQPLPDLEKDLAKATMWTTFDRRFDAPTFQLGMGPCGSMYTTVTDLGRFLSILFAHGRTPGGGQILEPATLDTMWTPQYAPAGARSGYGIGFGIGSLDGHRSIGHDGAIYGFATTLQALPDDSVGAVVVATLDGANQTTDRIAQSALRMMLAARAGQPLPLPDTTRALDVAEARRLAGRYGAGEKAVQVTEYEGRLYLTPLRGGERAEVRRAADGGLITDDVLGYGTRVTPLQDGRLV